MSGNGYREIRVIYPTNEGGDELPEDAILIVDGLAAKVFRALTEDYGTIINPEAFTGGTKLLLSPGVRDADAGRLICKYLSAITDGDRDTIEECLTLDVVYKGFTWHADELVPVFTQTRDKLLDNIDNWREENGGALIYSIEEAFIAQTKAFVQFQIGKAERSGSCIYTLQRDEYGLRISEIMHSVPSDLHQTPTKEWSLTE